MGRLLNLRTWRRFNDPVLGVPRGHLPESPTVWGEGARKAGSEGARNAGPESQPNPASLPSGGNFPGRKQGGRGRRGGGSPRGDTELRARGAGRAASAATAASSPPRLRWRCLLPPPGSASLAPSPRGWLQRRRRRRRAGRACAGREVSAARGGKGSFKWKVVRRPARLLALLRQHHGGAERLARARPAAPAGGPGGTGGGGPGGRDSSAGSGGTRGPSPGGAGGRLAHLQGRVRAAGGYRSVLRARRGWLSLGAEAGREGTRDAGLASMHAREAERSASGPTGFNSFFFFFF